MSVEENSEIKRKVFQASSNNTPTHWINKLLLALILDTGSLHLEYKIQKRAVGLS